MEPWQWAITLWASLEAIPLIFVVALILFIVCLAAVAKLHEAYEDWKWKKDNRLKKTRR